MLAKWGISKGLGAAEVEGEFEVGGTLLSGIKVSELNTKPLAVGGNSPIKKLSVGEAKVQYDFTSLLRGDPKSGVKSVTLKDVEADIALPSSTDTESDKGHSATDKDPLEMVWKLLNGSYDLENINVSLTRENADNIVIEDFFLSLPAKGEGEVGFRKLQIGEKIDRGPIKTTLRSTGDSLVVGEIEPINGVKIEELTLNQNGSSMLDAMIELAGGRISATYGRQGAIAAQLVEGAVDLGTLANTFKSNDQLKSGRLDELDVEFTGDFSRPSTWNGQALVGVAGIELRTEGVDSAKLLASVSYGKVDAKLNAERKNATLDLKSEADLTQAPDSSLLASAPADLELTLVFPSVAPLLPENAPPVAGGATLTASLQIQDRELRSGTARFTTNALAYDGVAINELTIDAKVPETSVIETNVAIAFDNASTLKGTGTLGLKDLDYNAKMEAEAVMNTRLRGLLATFHFDQALNGNASIDWSGLGSLKQSQHEGSGSVSISDFQLADGRPIDGARVRFSYTPELINIDSVEAQSGDLAFAAAGKYENQIISVSPISLRQSEQQLAGGSITIPYDPAAFVKSGPAGFFTQDGEVKIELKSDQLRLQDLAAFTGSASPVQGTLTANIAVEGTPKQLDGDGRVDAQALKLTGAPELPPGDLLVTLSLGGERLLLDGKFTHPDIQPLTLNGGLPFRPEAWALGEAALSEAPIEAAVRLPKSSLEVVTGYTDAIEAIDGTAAVDVKIGGTVSKPTVVGVVEIAIADLKLDDPAAPELRDTYITLRANAVDRAVVIERFESLVSGGKIMLEGDISFPSDGPLLNVSAKAREALLARAPDYNVRADADLTLSGPWASAALAGRIGLTNSRFIKEIDILPIGLPSTSERSNLPEIEKRPPAVKTPPNLDFGLDVEPFKNWSVDVSVVTKDAFIVRGNIARADVISDLRLSGTGAAPIPNGRVYLDDGRLTLPFSKVDISEGQVVFTEATGFNGRLTAQASATIRKWQVSVYVYGRILDPEYVLTSDPPLPAEDIISLLATGTTRDELASESGAVAASKAAQLFLKKLKQDTIDPDDEPTFLQELEERTTIDFGQSDARTGERTLAGRIRLFRQLYFVASASREGTYRGLLKYIFKFR